MAISDILSPVFSFLSDAYNFLLTSQDPLIRFLSLSLGLALYIFFVWHFYHKISTRDMAGFIPKQEERGFWDRLRQFFSKFFYIVKYLVFFPLYAFLWFAFLAVAMALLNPGQGFESIFFISALIISTTRILAYLNEDAAQEISKLLPLVFISTVLLNQTVLEAPLDLEKMFDEYLIPLSIQYFMIIIPLEVVLRLIHDTKRLFFPEYEVKVDKAKFPKFEKK